jgi:hypothetical protein
LHDWYFRYASIINFQDCLPSGNADFIELAALQDICGSTLQLHTLRLAYAANSTLAKFRINFFEHYHMQQ